MCCCLVVSARVWGKTVFNNAGWSRVWISMSVKGWDGGWKTYFNRSEELWVKNGRPPQIYYIYIWVKNDEKQTVFVTTKCKWHCYHVLSQCFETLWTQSNWVGKPLLLLRCDSPIINSSSQRNSRPSKSNVAFWKLALFYFFWKRNLDPGRMKRSSWWFFPTPLKIMIFKLDHFPR